MIFLHKTKTIGSAKSNIVDNSAVEVKGVGTLVCP